MLQSKNQQMVQQQAALQQRNQELQSRAATLDQDNQEIESLLAQTRQHSKLVEDQLAAVRDQLSSATTQLVAVARREDTQRETNRSHDGLDAAAGRAPPLRPTAASSKPCRRSICLALKYALMAT